MILTCPACSTRFAIDSNALGAGGRRVRCGSCRHVWHQAAPMIETEHDPLPKLFVTDEEARPGDASGGAGAEPDSALRPAQAMRPLAAHGDSGPRRGRAMAGLAWAALVVVVAGAAGGAYVMRDAVVEAWPPARSLYEAAGIATEPAGAGLQLRKVTWKQEKDDGQSVLTIEGEIANISPRVRNVPNIRGAIVGSGGREIRHWVFAPPEPKLLPGESARFRTELRNPPDGAERLTMNFSDE